MELFPSITIVRIRFLKRKFKYFKANNRAENCKGMPEILVEGAYSKLCENLFLFKIRLLF